MNNNYLDNTHAGKTNLIQVIEIKQIEELLGEFKSEIDIAMMDATAFKEYFSANLVAMLKRMPIQNWTKNEWNIFQQFPIGASNLVKEILENIGHINCVDFDQFKKNAINCATNMANSKIGNYIISLVAEQAMNLGLQNNCRNIVQLAMERMDSDKGFYVYYRERCHWLIGDSYLYEGNFKESDRSYDNWKADTLLNENPVSLDYYKAQSRLFSFVTDVKRREEGYKMLKELLEKTHDEKWRNRIEFTIKAIERKSFYKKSH